MNSVDLPVLAAQKSIDAPFVVWIDRDDRINTRNLKLMTGGPLERLYRIYTNGLKLHLVFGLCSCGHRVHLVPSSWPRSMIHLSYNEWPCDPATLISVKWRGGGDVELDTLSQHFNAPHQGSGLVASST